MKCLACLLLAALLTAGCGSEGAALSGPSPIVPTSPPVFTGVVTETITGMPIPNATTAIAGGRLTVSAPGYITRETRADARSVDLIREPGFDLSFYREFARGTLGAPAWPLRVLAQPPAIYLQTAGLSASHVAMLAQTARDTLPALTGGRFQVGLWETGTEARPERAGWIVVDLIADDARPCGESTVGGSRGHIWLNTATKCTRAGLPTGYPSLFGHELGHALGFWHVSAPNMLMTERVGQGTIASGIERHHAAIAYARAAGNLDIDVDATSATMGLSRVIVQ